MSSSQKSELENNSKRGILSKLPRSTIASRARAQLNSKGVPPTRTVPNTPHLERSRASSVCEELLKPALGTKEETFTSNNEVAPLECVETDDLTATDDVKFNFSEIGEVNEEMMYMNKTNEFEMLKKDLQERQTAILLLYSHLHGLHSKIGGEGREVRPLEPTLQLLNLGQGLRGPLPIGDGLELQKIITELLAQPIAVCHEILASRNAVFNCLKSMGSNDKSRRVNLTSKIRQWEAESEKLCMVVGSTAQTADRSALNISTKLSELVHQAMTLNSENVEMKEEQLQLKTQLEQAKKQIDRVSVDRLPDKSSPKQQSASLIKTPLQYGGQRRMEIDNPSEKEDLQKRQHDLELITQRSRIRDLERELKELNATHAAQTEILKTFEAEVKQRDIQHGSHLRTLRQHVRDAEQKMNAIAQERDNLHTSAQNDQKEGENLLCGLKERILDLEKALEEQKENTSDALKKLAAEKITMQDLAKKNDAEMAKECGRLKDLLTAAEEELANVKQKNSDYVKEIVIILESKEIIANELMAKKITTNKLHRELAELRDQLFNVSQERNKYLESLEQKMTESGDSTLQEQELSDANTFIASKVEEVRKLQSIVASKDRDNQILSEQIVAMEEHLKICQRRRVQYENKITALGTEVQSLRRSAQKRYSETWADSVLSKLSEEFPQMKEQVQKYAWDPYSYENNMDDPMGHQSGDNFPSLSELISQQRNTVCQQNKDELSARPSSASMFHQHEYQSDRPQVVTILRPYRRVRLTPEMRLQPISSLISCLQRSRPQQSSAERPTAKDLFPMSNYNNA